jgi:hypothetical protein
MPIFSDLQNPNLVFVLSLSLSLSLSQQDHPSPAKSHWGLVGSTIVRKLCHLGFANLILRTHTELDLTHQSDVDTFFATEKPRFVILAAAMVNGIHANNTYPTDFIAVKPRHLKGPPQGAPGVVRPPPGHARGG